MEAKMSKKFFKLIIFIFLLYVNGIACASNSASFENSLTVQLGNLSRAPRLPKHDFAYEMKIPSTETSKGSPLVGFITYNSRDISTDFSHFDNDNIEVNLNIFDPSMAKRIIWQGKIVYNKALNKLESLPEVVDNQHYQLYVNLIQPDQGRPQFIIGIISI